MEQPQLGVGGCQWWQFPDFVELRGRLLVADLATMPFEVRRVFFISKVPADETRGDHAQRINSEILLSLRGSVIVTIDDGKTKQQITLRKQGVGLFIPPKIWCALSHFSADAVLAVFASHPYNPANQISDYSEFLSVVATNS